MWTHYVARDTKPEILADMPSKHVPKVDRFPSTIETPASNGEVREEESSVEDEPVKNGGGEEGNNPESEESPQLPPVSFEDAVPAAAPEPEVTPEPEQAVNGHEQAGEYQYQNQQQEEESSEVPTEAPESSPQVPAVENAPLISEAQGETPPVEVPLEPSANGISYGAGGNGWEVCSFSFNFARSLCKGSCQFWTHSQCVGPSYIFVVVWDWG